MKILLHDDWEINGDGTGDPRQLMFEPARKLLDLCDLYGAKYTFFAEVMQQLAMRESKEPSHREWAREWEQILLEAIRRGHDVQLHIHPQWIGAQFDGNRWNLDYSKWSIASLNGADMLKLISDGKAYLEALLTPVCPGYEVVAFRAGGWMAQPSGRLIRALRQAGILADCSVVPGKRMAFQQHGSIDYSQAYNKVLPWWVANDDVAAAGDERSGVIELPTYAEEFRGPLPLHLLRKNWKSVQHYLEVFQRRKQQRRVREFAPPASGTKGAGRLEGLLAQRSTYCSFGYMHYRTLLDMVQNASRSARLLGIEDPLLVMLTHSKSFLSYSNFEQLLKELSEKPEISFSRTRDCVRALHSGNVPGLPLSVPAQNLSVR